jgi:hypothetical protein
LARAGAPLSPSPPAAWTTRWSPSSSWFSPSSTHLHVRAYVRVSFVVGIDGEDAGPGASWDEVLHGRALERYHRRRSSISTKSVTPVAWALGHKNGKQADEKILSN